MKKTATIVFLLLCSIQSFGQGNGSKVKPGSLGKIASEKSSYIPFPEQNTTWNITRTTYCFPGAKTYDFSLRYNGDTTIQGKTYKKMVSVYYLLTSSWGSCIGISGAGRYEGAIRQDTVARKVYYKPIGFTDEVLLYDFTLQVGDTLDQEWNTGYWKVASIDDVAVVGGQLRKRWNLTEADCPNDTTHIIEGIGSVEWPLARLRSCITDGDDHKLNCMALNGNPKYLASGTGNCDLITAIQSFFSSPTFSLYPNPASETIQLKTESPILSITINDAVGHLVKTPLMASLPENQNQLNISSLRPGMYYVRIQTAEGTAVQKVVKE